MRPIGPVPYHLQRVAKLLSKPFHCSCGRGDRPSDPETLKAGQGGTSSRPTRSEDPTLRALPAVFSSPVFWLSTGRGVAAGSAFTQRSLNSDEMGALLLEGLSPVTEHWIFQD